MNIDKDIEELIVRAWDRTAMLANNVAMSKTEATAWLRCNLMDEIRAFCQTERNTHKDRIEDLKNALRPFTDNEPCHFDHHGCCQTHGGDDGCKNTAAKQVLENN